jgi:uncharacterized protein YecE (DUF72 family)
MAASEQLQATLFELPSERLEAAPPRPEHAQLAAQLPAEVRLGTMSWTFPGWRGIVYAANARAERLAAEGLTAYAQHPLLRAVELDRSYYDPPSSESLRELAEQVPEDFRFVVKAHQACTIQRFPQHARYGKKRGEANALFLDAGYASEVVIGPSVEGLSGKLSALLFQFSPEDFGAPHVFAERLQRFLEALPKGIPYAVELRNPVLLSAAYATALSAGGGVHCHNAWGEMPSVLAQAKALPPVARRPLIVRWLFPPGDSYAAASERLAPFDRIVLEDPIRREAIARLVANALRHDVPALVLVNNDAEGCAPESIYRLARAIAQRCASA